jgi:hypothetical protein
MSVLIDARSPRFGAALTSVVLAVVLLTGSAWLLAAQLVVFALGALGRPPYGLLFRRVVRPRLGPPTELEDPAPPRFAQLVGTAFALLGLIFYAVGVTLAGEIFVGFALVAALLNATVGLCLGCELYLLFQRRTARSSTQKEVIA